HGDTAVACRIQIDVVDTGAEIGDELELRPGLRNNRPVDAIRNRRDQNVGGFGRFDDLRGAHRLVVDVEARVEQFAHPRLDDIWKLARDDDYRLFRNIRHGVSKAV